MSLRLVYSNGATPAPRPLVPAAPVPGLVTKLQQLALLRPDLVRGLERFVDDLITRAEEQSTT